MLKVVNKTQAGFLVVFSALALGACGGGGGSGGSGGGGGGDSATELKPGVFYAGKWLSPTEDGEKPKELVGESFVSSTDKFVIFFRNEFKVGGASGVEKSYTFGDLKYSSGEFSAKAEEYEFRTIAYKNESKGWEKKEGTIFGNVKSSKEADLSSSASESNNVTNSVLGRDDKNSDSGITIADIYSTFEMVKAGKATTVNIQPDSSDKTKGVLKIDLGNNCNVSGTVSVPDQSINVFEVTYNASNCPPVPDGVVTESIRNGDYTGLGTYEADDKKLRFYSQNGTEAWMFEGKK